MNVQTTFVGGINPWTGMPQSYQHEMYPAVHRPMLDMPSVIKTVSPVANGAFQRDKVLALLHKHVSCTVMEIADALNCSEVAAYKSAQRLVKTGFISRSTKRVAGKYKPLNVYHLWEDPHEKLRAEVLEAVRNNPGANPIQVKQQCNGVTVGALLESMYKESVLKRKREFHNKGTYYYWIKETK